MFDRTFPKTLSSRLVQDYRERSDFREDSFRYLEFIEDMEKEVEGLPKPTREDIVISLCEGNYSFALFENVKKLKVSQAAMIVVYREKEAFRIWKHRKLYENN